jgi:hypothetical protein
MELLPFAEGAYHWRNCSCYIPGGGYASYEACMSGCPPNISEIIPDIILVNSYSTSYSPCGDPEFCGERTTSEGKNGLLEFDLSPLPALTRGSIAATLNFTVKSVTHGTGFLRLYDFSDSTENGIIAINDDASAIYREEININSPVQAGDVLSYDVTSAVEHDLFDTGQTIYSGFAIKKYAGMLDLEFYAATDPENGNSSLIPAQGSATKGASYEFIDTNVQNRKTYYYKLEDIDLNGQSTMHGPVSATPRWIWGIFGIFGK